METLIVFGVLTVPIVIVSWPTVVNVKSHGFYRFFSWECMAWLMASNFRYWFHEPFSTLQLVSWILLLLSIYLVVAGAVRLKKAGKPTDNRSGKELYKFEKTSELVDTGIYKYIRHPLYSSLLFLTWGILFKNITLPLLVVSMLSTLFLFLTAIYDEKECIQHFGLKYIEYMKRSKRFIPFIV